MTEPTTTGDDEQLTATQAAAHLGVSRQTLHRWERAGVVHRSDPHGPPRYSRATLDRAAAERQAKPTPAQVRERIVRATASLAASEGTSACTIDAVAERAQLSRGGVLYHFQHKRDLLAATVDTFLVRFEERWESHTSRLPDGTHHRLARAYVAATVAPDDDLVAALLVCAVEEPRLMPDVQRRVRSWYRRLDDDGGDEALTIALAADALWLFGLLGLRPLPAARERQVTDHLSDDRGP